MKQLILLPNNMNCKTAQGKLHTHLAGYIYAYGSNNYIKKKIPRSHPLSLLTFKTSHLKFLTTVFIFTR